MYLSQIMVSFMQCSLQQKHSTFIAQCTKLGVNNSCMADFSFLPQNLLIIALPHHQCLFLGIFVCSHPQENFEKNMIILRRSQPNMAINQILNYKSLIILLVYFFATYFDNVEIWLFLLFPPSFLVIKSFQNHFIFQLLSFDF